jgi:hypothetical protein
MTPPPNHTAEAAKARSNIMEVAQLRLGPSHDACNPVRATHWRRITSVMLCDSFSAVVHPLRGYFSIAGLRLHRLQGFQIFDAKRQRE